MARISGVTPQQAGWLLRLFYKMVQGQTQKLAGKAHLGESVQVAAHTERTLTLLWAEIMASAKDRCFTSWINASRIFTASSTQTS